jgi:hypothetical protein
MKLEGPTCQQIEHVIKKQVEDETDVNTKNVTSLPRRHSSFMLHRHRQDPRKEEVLKGVLDFSLSLPSQG